MASSSSSPSSSARARESGLPWCLLDRVPRVVAQEEEMPSDAAVVLRLAAPPSLSTLEVKRFVFTSVASNPEPRHCRVEGADTAGRLLLRFTAGPASTGEGERDSDSSSSGSGSLGHGLVVCVPVVATRDAVVATAEKTFLLPDFPSPLLNVNIPPGAPAGILAYHGTNDAGYSVAILHRSPPSSSFAASALCYSSDNRAWTESQVRASDHHWALFDADSVVSHKRRGDRGGCLVFVDPARGLLMFDPRLPESSSFIGFPQLPEGAEMERAYVHSSDGALVCVATYNLPDQGGPMIRMWSLHEEDDEWRLELPHSLLEMGLDEIFSCDQRLPYQVRGIALTVHPHCLSSLFVSLVGDTCWNLSIVLDPAGMPFSRERARTRLLKILQFTASETPALLVCRVHTSETGSGWVWERLMGLTASAISVVKASRKHLHRLPGAIETVGRLLNIPVEPAVKIAKTINAINDGYNKWETAQATLLSAGQQARIEYVGTEEEAKRVIEQWIHSGRSSDVRVEAVSGMSSEDRHAIRRVFVERGAEALIPRPPAVDESTYVFVEPVVHFWAD